MNGEIKLDVKDGIAIITISRPEKLNSVTWEMLDDFEEKMSQMTNDPNITVVVFTGEGNKAFCAGFDLNLIKSLHGDEHTRFFSTLARTMKLLKNSRNTVTIAALNGYTIGFGAMIAVASDFRFFAQDAIFKLPEIDIDVFPGSGAASNLIHLVGPARTKDILMTARPVGAQEALRIGLADRIFAKEELLEKTIEFANLLKQKNRKILAQVKTLVDAMTDLDIEAAAEIETMYTDEWLREARGE